MEVDEVQDEEDDVHDEDDEVGGACKADAALKEAAFAAVPFFNVVYYKYT